MEEKIKAMEMEKINIEMPQRDKSLFSLKINGTRRLQKPEDVLIFALTCLPPFPFEQGAQGKLFLF